MRNYKSDIAVIELFERTVARYVGAAYGIAVSSNTNGIFLALQYLLHRGRLQAGSAIDVPRRTYLSVPMSIIHAGFKIRFVNTPWRGYYRLAPTNIYDAATAFFRNMCADHPRAMFVLSFQYRKSLPIGKGGMIMTNDKQARDYLVKARFNGRPSAGGKPAFIGWNMYLTPEQAGRGLTLLEGMDLKNSKITSTRFSDGSSSYPDISAWKIWHSHRAG